jgi:hypothetical protein
VTAAALTAEELARAAAPHLVTELPGPKARALVERDARVTSPSLPRAYPLVPVRARSPRPGAIVGA